MPAAVQRLLDLIEFAKQSALLRATPARSVAQHKQFYRFEEKVRALPGIHFNELVDEPDEVWLRLDRLHESAPPVPESRLLSLWIDLSNSPLVEPKLHTSVERSRLVEVGALPGELSAQDQSQPSFVALDEYPEKEVLQRHFQSYMEVVWKRWSGEEAERRKSIELYGELFRLSLQMQGNLVDSQLELVWGFGVSTWRLDSGAITYPVLSQPAEISLNEKDMSIEIRPRLLEPHLEIDIYAAQDNPGVAKLADAAKAFFAECGNSINPFEPSTYEGLLRSAANHLDPQGVYWPDQTTAGDRALPKATNHLIVTDTWAIFARPRTASLFVQDLVRFERAVEEGELPLSVAALVTDPSDTSDEVALPAFRGLSLVESGDHSGSLDRPTNELYFPMPFNDEQVRIVQYLESHEGVVVQGPPGTGKTHTIANVICHYLAQGKRVLVTSMKDPALTVLRDKIPEDIRPLAISLLTSEAEGMKQFEFAINRISAEVQRIDRSAYRQEISRIDARINELHVLIAKTDRNIAQWAVKNLEPIAIDGDKIDPADAAREVASNRSEIEWLTDEISIHSAHQAQFSNADIVALREARRSLGKSLSYLGMRVPMLSDFPDSQKLLQVHQDLSQFSKLKAQESAGEVPALIDGSEETLQAAIGLAARVNNLRLLHQDLKNTNQPWITKMRDCLTNAASSEALGLLQALKVEIEKALAQRKQFLARPIWVPPALDQNAELIQAVGNLGIGSRPFGLAGLVGKSEQKKLLGTIMIVHEKPASPSDWKYIGEYLASQKTSRGLLARWNALAGELPLPKLVVSPEHLGEAGAALGLFAKIQKLTAEESIVTNDFKRLIPTWRHIEQLPHDTGVLDEAETMLTHHLVRHRLGQAWAIKEAFLKGLSGTSGDISDRLRVFLDTRLGNNNFDDATIQAEWSAMMEELRRVLGLAPHLTVVAQASELIEASGAQQWAKQLREVPHPGASDPLLPDNWREVWRLRRLMTYLDSIDARQELKRLSAERTELEHDLAKQYRNAVNKRTWLQLSLNATDAVRAALEAYRAAISKIGKGTGIRAIRYRQDARKAAERANPAIPCWIMPHYRVCESLPPSFGCFDLVIIDEASQSDLSALPAILRAKKILIVGDDKQVSPEGVGLEEEKIRNLMGRFLGNQVEIFRSQMTPERSIYDLFKVVFAKSSVMLREHFRCTAPIIEYSKREFYNHELRPLRVPKSSERLDPPLVDVYIEDGYRNGDVNEAEAKFIVDEIGRIVQAAEFKGRTVGVVSLIGDKQALRVMKLLEETIGEETITRFGITCGDARTFQGKERDIMFLSMVVDASKVTAQTQEMFAQRFNVAASRARDRMYLVRSVTLDDLSHADTLRSRLIQHFQAPFGQDPEEVADLRDLCESPFEREVFDLLIQRGYRVIPQVPVGSYRIDMVVEGENDKKLAIECDGDRYHGPDQWDHDMRRQRILERAGWRFWRCFASAFVLHREQLISDLLETLAAHGVAPTSVGSPIKTIHSEQRRIKAFAKPDLGQGDQTTADLRPEEVENATEPEPVLTTEPLIEPGQAQVWEASSGQAVENPLNGSEVHPEPRAHGARVYTPSLHLEVGEWIVHRWFGLGIVKKRNGNKVEVQFQDSVKTLVSGG